MKRNSGSRRVFLDTCTLNFIVDYQECIFMDATPPATLDPSDVKDIAALRHILSPKRQSLYELAVSPYTYAEVMRTRDEERQRILEDRLRPIWDHWISTLEQNGDLPTLPVVERFKVQLLILLDLYNALPEVPDRILLTDALLYGCDYFCTRDRRTILDLSHRPEGLLLVLQSNCMIANRRIKAPRIVSPAELWEDLIAVGQC